MSVSQETQTDQPQNQDVVDLLRQQHQEVRQLFSQLDQTTGDDKRDPFEQLVRLLAVHETAEEEVIYPVVRRMIDDGDNLADARISEEAKAKEVLAELEKLGPDHPDFDARLDSFKELVLNHADSEEQEVFPALREAHSRDQLQAMAVGVQAAETVAPTHPHPRGPESAIGNMAVGPFVAIADRVRDAIRKARR